MDKDIFIIEYPATKGTTIIGSQSNAKIKDKHHTIILDTKDSDKKAIKAYMKPDGKGGYYPVSATFTIIVGLSYQYSDDAELFLSFAKRADSSNFHYEKIRYVKWAILSAVFAIEALLNEKGIRYSDKKVASDSIQLFFSDKLGRLNLKEKLLLWAEFIKNKTINDKQLLKEFDEIRKLRDRLVHSKPENAESILSQLTIGEGEKAIRVFKKIEAFFS